MHAPEPRDADFATRWKNIIAQVRLRVVHHKTNYVCELYKKYLSSQCSNDFTTPVQSSRCPEFMAMTGATCEEDDRAVNKRPLIIHRTSSWQDAGSALARPKNRPG